MKDDRPEYNDRRMGNKLKKILMRGIIFRIEADVIKLTENDNAICNSKGSDHLDQLPLLSKLAG